MLDRGGQWALAQYETFNVGDASSGYALAIGDYKPAQGLSDAGDSWQSLHGAKFSLDHEAECNKKRGSGWFLNGSRCGPVNIFGAHRDGGGGTFGIFWRSFRGFGGNLPYLSVQVRPKDFNATKNNPLPNESDLIARYESAKRSDYQTEVR
eukprot:maker-scaffold1162_size58306-snap-gene-0.5 protein:Tk04219 transcript:maker-scaffold1162_size58306-snap-gene-0.5-mRNA-1 annotation:"predicted protein"